MPEQSPPPTPAERALSALGDAVGASRPRVPADGLDPDVPVAATVVLVRDGEAGPEVLLLERPDRGSFAGAWVFPGGKVDDADRAADDSEAGAALAAAIRETWEETGLVVDPAALVSISVWDPPPGLALRIRTWFFVASAPLGELVLSRDEVVQAEWLTPLAALARHASGAITLYPPTWVTLHRLGSPASTEALLEAARAEGSRRFETVARPGPRGPMLLWQEDADYDAPAGERSADDDAAAAASARHRLELGVLPWIYTRPD